MWAGALSLLIGLVLGLLGGGGAILALPVLVYVAGVDARAAIAMSLFVVGATSGVGAALHARAGRVRWKAGLWFAAAAMPTAFVAGRLAHLVPATALLLGFSGVMLLTAGAMLRGRREVEGPPGDPLPLRLLSLGALTGLISGLVGAGGGFLIVPALTLFGGLAMREAVGTSLFVIALQAFAGFAGHLGHVSLDWALTAGVTASALAGLAVGVSLSPRVPGAVLRKAFAWLVLVMGVLMVGRQLLGLHGSRSVSTRHARGPRTGSSSSNVRSSLATGRNIIALNSSY